MPLRTRTPATRREHDPRPPAPPTVAPGPDAAVLKGQPAVAASARPATKVAAKAAPAKAAAAKKDAPAKKVAASAAKAEPAKKEAMKKEAPAKKAAAAKTAAKPAAQSKDGDRPPAKSDGAAAKSSPPRRPAATAAVKKASPAPRQPAEKPSAPRRPATTAAVKKVASPTAVAEKAPAPAPEPAPAKVVTGYTEEKFLEHQREALLAERATYLEQAASLRAEAESLVEEMEPGDIQFDEESGEGGTVTVDRERDLALSAQALAAVEEIDAALAKMASGRYGICEGCGELIAKPRLEALPYARLCIACKSGGLSRR